MKTSVGLAALLVTLSSAAGANAQTVFWQSPVGFDHGGQTAVATNGVGAGQEIEAHLGGSGGYNNDFAIWYDGASWGSGFQGGWELPYWNGLNSFDSGFSLSIAADPTSWSPLFTMAFSQQPPNQQADGEGVRSFINYQTGNYSGGQLNLTYGNSLAQGFYPSLAEGTVNGQTYFLEVQNGQDTNQTLTVPDSSMQLVWGKLNSDGVSISWENGNNPAWFGTGWYPTVAMWPMNGNTFFVAVAYQQQSQGTYSPLNMLVGQWTVGSTWINWTASYTEYAVGGFPSVAVCARNEVPAVLVEVHEYGVYEGVYMYGNIEGGWRTWQGPYRDGFLPGTVSLPHVACNTFWGVESHNDNNGNIYTTKFSLN